MCRFNQLSVALVLSFSVLLNAGYSSRATGAVPADFVTCLLLGGAQFTNWTGLEISANGAATLTPPKEAIFTYPAGKRGWYYHGFRQENDSTRDWREFHGLQLEMNVPAGRVFELQAVIKVPSMAERQEYLLDTRASVTVSGEGWQRVTLPWRVFDFEQGRGAFLEFVSELRLSGRFADGGNGEVKLRNIRLVRAPVVALQAGVRGKAVPLGATASYEVAVGNCTDEPQDIALSFEKIGWETMTTSVSAARFLLGSGQSTNVTVTVRIPETGIAPGGHERQRLLASTKDGVVGSIDFITARDVERPSLQLTRQGWAAVREKADDYDWAGQEEEGYVRAAQGWSVPLAARPPNNVSHGHVYSFDDKEFNTLLRTAQAWLLTGNTNCAEKVALFLRRLADDENGYPATFAGTDQGEPQEGDNFQGVAIAYDAIRDAGVLSDADRRAIERMLRLYMATIETSLRSGNVGNWNVAAATSGLFCALAMGDLAAAERYLHGPCGFTDYVTKGIMDDGWWWEGSTSYNFWVASELTQCALAMRPWGIDLLNQEFPANFSPRTTIVPWGLNPQYGMSFEKWGAHRRNTRSVKQLWDAVPRVADYRGVVFGINDGHEEFVGGSRMELGYHAFRDPAYLPLLKQSAKRDLIYGVSALPETTAAPYLDSSLAENLGVALLRSQTTNRPPREQIEAVFKIGTQGGYHGHFDRCSLNTIMRYGRSFWNPESIWWGYGNYMYKFYVQTSVSKNMVVVDQKQQEAVPSKQLLFFSGKMMQVSLQETVARWSDPPYGGMKYSARDSGGAVADFPAGMRKNRQSVPLVPGLEQGQLGGYTERVLQRRLGIVTDDYILVADYLKSSQPHTFDNLFQIKSLQSLEAPDKEFLRHEAHFNPDPRSAAQFITDCDWYRASAPSVARFQVEYDGDLRNAAGALKVDVHSVWPRQQQLMLAQPPENLGGQQWVNYEILADGKSLAKGESGMWVLGEVAVDVPVAGAKELEFKITTEGGNKKTLFLDNPRFVNRDGEEQSLSDSLEAENIEGAPQPGHDYYDGPIKISGMPAKNAVAVQPMERNRAGLIRSPVVASAASFKATLGADYPFGDESERRRILASRVTGTEARFLTVVEPYEDKPMVKSVTATSADALRVELADGRMQEIVLKGLEGSGRDAAVEITESQAGKVMRHESTAR